MRIGDPLPILITEALGPSRKALELDVTVFLIRHRNENIRCDALFVYDTMTRCVILGCGQAQRRPVLQRENALDRTFAESFLAKNDAAFEILEATSNNLRSTGAATVNEHHHRNTLDHISMRPRAAG